MNIPGEHLNGVMSANEFLTRVNLMQARLDDYETPLPIVKDKNVIVIGGGNTAMDAARTAKRLGGNVTIVYRRTRKEMPARVEELAHALEEGIELAVLRAPREFVSGGEHHVCHAVLDVMELGRARRLGPPLARRHRQDRDHRRSISSIMALGNDSNPIIKDSEPRIKTSKWGTLRVEHGARDDARRRLLRRRRHPRRLDGDQRRRRRQGRGGADRQGDPLHARPRSRTGSRARRAYTAKAQTPVHDRQAARHRPRHRRDHGEGADGRQVRQGRPVRARAADAARAS